MAAQEGWPVPLLEIRQTGGNQTNNATNLTNNQVLALEAVSLSLATISVFAAFLAFFWFVRIRRSFRQDLIMLLIQSDMMKAFWLMLSPIIYFISGPDGPINTASAYCQISGFFLTAAIEASDIAVLMIAIHSALYILRSQRPGGEAGLHPYRWYAYSIWLVVPLVLASIIPLTGARFEDNGPFCYLPAQGIWYRIYLSWVPRYIIFGVIFLVYAFLYVYIAWRFRRLRLDQKRASFQGGIPIRTSSKLSGRRQRGQAKNQVVPLTPPLAAHGLLDSLTTPATEEGQRSRQHSVTSDVSTLKFNDNLSTPLPSQRREHRAGGTPLWNWMIATYDGGVESPKPRDGTNSVPISPTTEPQLDEVLALARPPTALQGVSNLAIPSEQHAHGPALTQIPSRRFWRPSSSRSQTITTSEPTILGVLQQGPPSTEEHVRASSSPSLFQPLSITEDTLRKSRDKMRRQLRLLFVYPAIYIIAWICPFISQVYRYENPLSQGSPQPYGVFMTSIASLCIGAAVDCIFYSAWEKPWRHRRCGFWEGLAMRLKLRRRPHAGGRSREEARKDASAALERRNVEQASWKAAAASHRDRAARSPRQWWDLADDDSL